jgi:glycerophosphoryl diester phosphodiesterase
MEQMIRNTIIILFCLLLIANSSFAQQSRVKELNDIFTNRPAYIMVTAHRAAHQKYPENSLNAIKEAIRLQTDIIEIDVRETKDQNLVIVHDESIDRITNGKGKVKDLTLKELKEKNLLFEGKVTDQKILTFRKALREMKGKVIINLDFKADSKKSLAEASRLIKKEGMEDQILLYIYNKYDLIPVIKKLDPKIIIMPRAYSKSDIDKILTFPNIKVIQIDFSFYNDEWAKEVIQKGIRLSGNALGNYDEMQQKDGTGYDELTMKYINIMETDFPEELLLYLRKRGLHL